MSPVISGGSGGPGGLTQIFNSTLGVAATSIDTGANGVSATHGNLIIYLYLRSDRAANTADNYKVQLNADTGANYDTQQLAGNNVTASASPSNATTSWIGTCPAATAAANVFGMGRIDVFNYDNTSSFKAAILVDSNAQTTTASTSEMFACQWRNTAAITRIAVAPVAGTNFLAGSRMTIYGTQ